MGLRPLLMFYSFSAGIDFRCQNLTSKVDPRADFYRTFYPLAAKVSNYNFQFLEV